MLAQWSGMPLIMRSLNPGEKRDGIPFTADHAQAGRAVACAPSAGMGHKVCNPYRARAARAFT